MAHVVVAYVVVACVVIANASDRLALAAAGQAQRGGQPLVSTFLQVLARNSVSCWERP